MKVAVIGCAHGELDRIYETIKKAEDANSFKVDLLLVCGDFQSVRNMKDLEVMACPPKYRSIGSFYKYYSGEKKAPVLTIFVGGNHEASEYLLEIPHGGWVAPNIYYLGIAGAVKYGGLRIAGMSGIYKRYDYNTGHHERAPLSPDEQRSVFHVRSYDILRLLQLQDPIDIFLSHDWPCGITRYGNESALCKKKEHFREEIAANNLGNPALVEILDNKRPRYWFSAHLHVKFAAMVPWEDTSSTVQSESENGGNGGNDKRQSKRARVDVGVDIIDIGQEIAMDKGKDKPNNAAQDKPLPSSTRFLALDKVLPGKQFLQVIDIDPIVEIEIEMGQEKKYELEYDCEWLAILRSTMMLWPHKKFVKPDHFDPIRQGKHIPTEQTVQWVRDRIMATNHTLTIPTDFQHTAPPHGSSPSSPLSNVSLASMPHGANPQTYALMLLLDDTPPPPRALSISTSPSPTPSPAPIATGSSTKGKTTVKVNLSEDSDKDIEKPAEDGSSSHSLLRPADVKVPIPSRSALSLPPPTTHLESSASEAPVPAAVPTSTGTGRMKLNLPPPKF